MKSTRFVLSVVLLSLSTLAFAQSDAQKSFDKMKTLAGAWQGSVTTDPPSAEMGNGSLVQVSMRVTSRETRWCTKCRQPERRTIPPRTTIP